MQNLLQFLMDESKWPHDGAKSLVVTMAFQNCLQIPLSTETLPLCLSYFYFNKQTNSLSINEIFCVFSK